MCIIALKPKGVEFTHDFAAAIINASRYNKDGIGFVLKRFPSNNSFYIKKGLFNPVDVVDELIKHKIRPEDELMVHMRIRTAGDVCDTNCHPFIISGSDTKDLCNGVVKNAVALSHNGMFNKYYKYGDSRSDTYNFCQYIAEFASRIGILYEIAHNSKSFLEFQRETISYNKLALISADDNIEMITIGSFIEDFNGCLFSNSMYLSEEERNAMSYHKLYT